MVCWNNTLTNGVTCTIIMWVVYNISDRNLLEEIRNYIILDSSAIWFSFTMIEY